jgi:2-polyprenyl-3-methyl-5-hydroxy-6-metoxy-1,4-benzoquinol methylase
MEAVMANNCKTTHGYWDALYAVQPVPKLSSNFSVGSRNLRRLFKQHIKGGMHVLEIGCAPGKQLAYIGKNLGATISGVDYSQSGIALSHKLFDTLGLKADLRCEDIFQTTFPSDSFDLVYSLGVIEHFEDPMPIVRKHMHLLKPNGVCLVIVPNFGGLYGRLQNFFDPENLKIHNTNIMVPAIMKSLAPSDLCGEVSVFYHGRMSPWLLNIGNKWPTLLSQCVNHIVNFLGLVQPFDVEAICPMLVLKITRC